MKFIFHFRRVKAGQLLNRSFSNDPCLFLMVSNIPANSNLPANRTGTWMRLGCLSVRDVPVSYICHSAVPRNTWDKKTDCK